MRPNHPAPVDVTFLQRDKTSVSSPGGLERERERETGEATKSSNIDLSTGISTGSTLFANGPHKLTVAQKGKSSHGGEK